MKMPGVQPGISLTTLAFGVQLVLPSHINY